MRHVRRARIGARLYRAFSRPWVYVPVFLGILFVVAAVMWLPPALERWSISRDAHACDVAGGSDDTKDACFLEIALRFMRTGDVLAAYRAFDYLYDTYPVFGAWGCHINAHRLGDTAYYEFFVTHGLQLSQMDFPQQTTSCGYGFFHGFLEHMIQDHPSPSYVKSTCEYLRTRLSLDMHDIARICYHASGHGFIQSMADSLKKAQWGSIPHMVTIPLEKCEALPDITAQEIEECREGVFNVMSDWMIEKNFGTSYDYKNPFAACDSLPVRWHWACYYEFGQKLEPVVGDSVPSAVAYVQSISEADIRAMTFGVMVVGMMQRLAPLNAYEPAFKACADIADGDLFKA